MAVNVDQDKCTGCGTCIDACPTESLSMNGDSVVVDEETCIDCGVCLDECPVQAFSLD